MAVSREEVQRIAALARLDLAEADMARLASELNEILGYVDALEATSLEEMAEPEVRRAPLREDVVASDPLQRPIAELAPEWREGFFLLPRLAALDAPQEPEGT